MLADLVGELLPLAAQSGFGRVVGLLGQHCLGIRAHLGTHPGRLSKTADTDPLRRLHPCRTR